MCQSQAMRPGLELGNFMRWGPGVFCFSYFCVQVVGLKTQITELTLQHRTGSVQQRRVVHWLQLHYLYYQQRLVQCLELYNYNLVFCFHINYSIGALYLFTRCLRPNQNKACVNQKLSIYIFLSICLPLSKSVQAPQGLLLVPWGNSLDHMASLESLGSFPSLETLLFAECTLVDSCPQGSNSPPA